MKKIDDKARYSLLLYLYERSEESILRSRHI